MFVRPDEPFSISMMEWPPGKVLMTYPLRLSIFRMMSRIFRASYRICSAISLTEASSDVLRIPFVSPMSTVSGWNTS